VAAPSQLVAKRHHHDLTTTDCHPVVVQQKHSHGAIRTTGLR
jgi:hypothetical protein